MIPPWRRYRWYHIRCIKMNIIIDKSNSMCTETVDTIIIGGGISGLYAASLDTLTITHAISDTLPQMPGFSPNPAAVDAVVDPGSGRIFAIVNN
ncbi:MAG: hypothetical protein EHM66_03525, partial [Deltaproteobacteria bacterium]